MNRIVTLALVVLIASPLATGPVARASWRAAMRPWRSNAMPAVVNISTWKVKQPEQEGDSPRRVKTYGSGFIIDPSGIIVTNKHVIDGAIDIKVIFENGDRVSGKLLAVAAMARPCGGEGGCRSAAAGAEMGRQREPACR